MELLEVNYKYMELPISNFWDVKEAVNLNSFILIQHLFVFVYIHASIYFNNYALWNKK